MGKTAGKNDVLIYKPKNRKFRSRNEVKKYFDKIGECTLKVEQLTFLFLEKTLSDLIFFPSHLDFRKLIIRSSKANVVYDQYVLSVCTKN